MPRCRHAGRIYLWTGADIVQENRQFSLGAPLLPWHAGKVAAALREGLFTALAVLIVYALLSRFYQPLDAIA